MLLVLVRVLLSNAFKRLYISFTGDLAPQASHLLYVAPLKSVSSVSAFPHSSHITYSLMYELSFFLIL